MRINPDYANTILRSISTAQNQENRALQQLSSGKRVNTPSDDPSAAAAVLLNHSRARANDQYTSNITSTTALLRTGDSALSQVVTALNSAISLGVQGGTETVNQTDRQQIAAQIIGIRDQILQLANTSYNGVYVFGGTETAKQPFVVDATSTSGVTYQGNTTVNQVSVADGRSVNTNTPGDQIFLNPSANVMGVLNDLTTALQNNDVTTIQTATTNLRSALANVSQQRVFYGNTVNQLTDESTYLAQDKLNIQTEENSLVGADMATAITQLNQATTNRSAVLAAAAKVLPQSLLDYLK